MLDVERPVSERVGAVVNIGPNRGDENVEAMIAGVLAQRPTHAVVCWTGGDVEPGYTMAPVAGYRQGDAEQARLINAFAQIGPTRCRVAMATAAAMRDAARDARQE
jgi:hypothetical protein